MANKDYASYVQEVQSARNDYRDELILDVYYGPTIIFR